MTQLTRILRSISYLALALALLLFSTQKAIASPIFNAFIFGNFTNNSADSEGTMLVGGNLTSTGGYTVGDPTVGFPLNAAVTTDSLIVGGNISTTGSAIQVYGSAVYGGTISGTSPAVQPIVGSSTTPTLTQNSAIQISKTGNVVSSGGVTIASLETTWQSQSQLWNGLASSTTGTVTTGSTINGYPCTLCLTGTNATFNIFTLTAAQAALFTGNASINIDVPPGSTVLINNPSTTVSLSNATFYYTNETVANSTPDNNAANECYLDKTLPICAQMQDIMLNFANATTFTSSGTLWYGSILAPKTTTVTLSGGAVNGDAIFGGNVTQTNGWEFHDFPVQDGDLPVNITETPEPSTLSLFGVACTVLLAGNAWRLRRKTSVCAVNATSSVG